MSEPLHFTLASGRVLLLETPLTAEEYAECLTPEGMAVLEALADELTRRLKRTVGPGEAEYHEVLRQHGLEDSENSRSTPRL